MSLTQGYIESQETQTGYRFPDGTEVFDHVAPRPSFFVADPSTVSGQERIQAAYQRHLKSIGLPEGGKLTFVQRVRMVSYSTSIPLVAIPDPEPDLSKVSNADDFELDEI